MAVGVKDDFEQFVDDLIFEQEACSYRKGWVWHRAFEQWHYPVWGRGELLYLASKLGYKAAWARFKWRDIQVEYDPDFATEKAQKEEEEASKQQSHWNSYTPPPGDSSPGGKRKSSWDLKIEKALALLDLTLSDWPMTPTAFNKIRRKGTVKYHPDAGGDHEEFIRFTEQMEFLERDLKLSGVK